MQIDDVYNMDTSYWREANRKVNIVCEGVITGCVDNRTAEISLFESVMELHTVMTRCATEGKDNIDQHTQSRKEKLVEGWRTSLEEYKYSSSSTLDAVRAEKLIKMVCKQIIIKLSKSQEEGIDECPIKSMKSFLDGSSTSAVPGVNIDCLEVANPVKKASECAVIEALHKHVINRDYLHSEQDLVEKYHNFEESLSESWKKKQKTQDDKKIKNFIEDLPKMLHFHNAMIHCGVIKISDQRVVERMKEYILTVIRHSRKGLSNGGNRNVASDCRSEMIRKHFSIKKRTGLLRGRTKGSGEVTTGEAGTKEDGTRTENHGRGDNLRSLLGMAMSRRGDGQDAPGLVSTFHMHDKQTRKTSNPKRRTVSSPYYIDYKEIALSHAHAGIHTDFKMPGVLRSRGRLATSKNKRARVEDSAGSAVGHGVDILDELDMAGDELLLPVGAASGEGDGDNMVNMFAMSPPDVKIHPAMASRGGKAWSFSAHTKREASLKPECVSYAQQSLITVSPMRCKDCRKPYIMGFEHTDQIPAMAQVSRGGSLHHTGLNASILSHEKSDHMKATCTCPRKAMPKEV